MFRGSNQAFKTLINNILTLRNKGKGQGQGLDNGEKNQMKGLYKQLLSGNFDDIKDDGTVDRVVGGRTYVGYSIKEIRP